MSACNVVHVPEFDRKTIVAGIRKTLEDPNFKAELKKCKNLYGDGHSSEKILEILKQVNLDRFLEKRMTY